MVDICFESIGDALISNPKNREAALAMIRACTSSSGVRGYLLKIARTFKYFN